MSDDKLTDGFWLGIGFAFGLLIVVASVVLAGVILGRWLV